MQKLVIDAAALKLGYIHTTAFHPAMYLRVCPAQFYSITPQYILLQTHPIVASRCGFVAQTGIPGSSTPSIAQNIVLKGTMN